MKERIIIEMKSSLEKCLIIIKIEKKKNFCLSGKLK